MGLLHTSLLSTIPEVQVKAICDQNKRISKMARKFSNKNIITNLLDLHRFDLDAVFVTTPITSHYHVINSVLTNKIAKNIFTEKALTMNFFDSIDLCETMKDCGGVNMVGYQKRFSVTFKKARELLKTGIIGLPESFKAYSYSSDFQALSEAKLEKLSISRGGVIRDLGAHAIDLVLWFFGDSALSSGTDDSVLFSRDGVRFSINAKNGVTGKVETSWCKEGYRLPETGLIIKGEKGELIVNDDRVEVNVSGIVKKWYRHDLNDVSSFVLWATEYYREDWEFIRCLLSHEECSPDFAESAKVDKIIEEANKLYVETCR